MLTNSSALSSTPTSPSIALRATSTGTVDQNDDTLSKWDSRILGSKLAELETNPVVNGPEAAAVANLCLKHAQDREAEVSRLLYYCPNVRKEVGKLLHHARDDYSGQR